MQGGCLSAILFIFYLAACLKKPIKTKMKGFLLKPKYADDMTLLGTSKIQIDSIKQQLPAQLSKFNLQMNQSKTEKYTIPRPAVHHPLHQQNNSY